MNIDCDAPPYAIVRACRKIGLQAPEDVRWFRLSRFRKGQSARLEFFNPRTWKALLGMQESRNSTCTCGQELPLLERYTFTFRTGRQSSYLIGQCRRCRTIYWDEV